MDVVRKHDQGGDRHADVWTAADRKPSTKLKGGDDEMKGFNWINRVLVCIIAALLLTLWFSLLL